MNTQYILSLSYGKDSLACLGAIEELNLPLDRIVHTEIWATNSLEADLPPMIEFKKRADMIIKEQWGIEVEHIRADRTFEDLFYEKWGGRSKMCGFIHGWPLIKGCIAQSSLKMSPIRKVEAGNISYVGIAVDEPERFGCLNDHKRSPLVEAGWTEKMCHIWCEENGLLSPIYNEFTRGGCWFCPNQGVQALRSLRGSYPELWKLMLKWDADSPVNFHADGHTVRDFDLRFHLEDEGLVPTDRSFRWKMIEREAKKLSLEGKKDIEQ